jgi:hypothetical protein
MPITSIAMGLTPPLSTGTNLAKLNKLKMLKDLANKKKLNAIHIAETYDQNPVAPGPLKGWLLLLPLQ